MALDIVFMGTPNFAVPILKTIYNSEHRIKCVYTQPPKKKNRGLKKDLSSIHKISNQLKIQVRIPEVLDINELNYIKKVKPHIVVVVAYGKIIPNAFFNINATNFINVHASLLPRWRGAAPIHRAIMNLDKETGVTIMKMVPKLDSGPILMSSKIKINQNTSFIELSNQMSELSGELLLKSIDILERNKASFIPQNEREATYAKKIQKSEAKINWDEDANKIVAKINALSSGPGAWFYLNGSRIKIIKAIEIKASGKPGEIVNSNFTIGCKKNSVKILELQKEGKKTLTTKEFLKGNKVVVGNILKD